MCLCIMWDINTVYLTLPSFMVTFVYCIPKAFIYSWYICGQETVVVKMVISIACSLNLWYVVIVLYLLASFVCLSGKVE